MTDLETFTEACIEAMYFTDTGDDEQPGRDADLSDETRADIEADCRSFWRRVGCYVVSHVCEDVGAGHGGPVAMAGYDFWLTRNGHGAGFWDGDWPDVYSDLLTEKAEIYGFFEIYLGDDGLIHA